MGVAEDRNKEDVTLKSVLQKVVLKYYPSNEEEAFVNELEREVRDYLILEEGIDI